LLKRADSWTAPGSFFPVAPSTLREAVDLIRDLSDALRQTLDRFNQITPNQPTS
jgi:hypothetical protein